MNISENDGRRFIDRCLTALQKPLDTFLRKHLDPNLMPEHPDPRQLLNVMNMKENWQQLPFKKKDSKILRAIVNTLRGYGDKLAHWDLGDLNSNKIGKCIDDTKDLLLAINANVDAIVEIEKINDDFLTLVMQKLPISNNKDMQQKKSQGESETEAIYIQDHHVAADVSGKKVYCPACRDFIFKRWPWGWDGHAGWKCSAFSHVQPPEKRKTQYKRRFSHLFKT